MRLRILIQVFCLLMLGSTIAQSIYPGGVVRSEIWYKSEVFNSWEFNDHSGNDVKIDFCNDYDKSLFNFNPSFYGKDLCFINIFALEQSVSRSQFIVADVHSLQDDYALTATVFNDFVLPPSRDSSSVNTYVIHTKDAYASQLNADMATQESAAIYASSWDQYAQTHKFKQYGLEGESYNYIGRSIPSLFIDRPDRDFYGHLPEFVYFDRALTQNEENRVASYLALKYGISLDKRLNYLDSKNQKFWNKENNIHFPNRIFGVGKDVVSDLYQSQAESRHAQDYLVFGMDQIHLENDPVIINRSFQDREFITIGDTGGSGFSAFQENIKEHKRTWLVQLTGQEFEDKLNYLQVNLDMLLDPNSQEYNDVKNRKLELRLLHDPYANNTQVSDFSHSEVNYIEPTRILSGNNGELYAHFEHSLRFNERLSKYHQFTFVLVDEVVVKFKPLYNCEEAREGRIDCYEVAIIIEEGEADPVQVFHPEEGVIDAAYSPEYTDEFGKPTFIFHGCVGSYDIVVHAASGRQFNYTYELESKGPYHVDLGPSVHYLDEGQPEIVLNANGNINDPDATFRWYKNGVLTEHTTETLLVDSPGRYCLEVITGDKVCTYWYCTQVEMKMSATISCESSCNPMDRKIKVRIDNGIPPFVTVISNNNGFYQEYYHDTDLIIDELSNDNYTITVEDAAGNIERGFCMIETSDWISFPHPNFNLTNNILSINQPSILLDTSVNTTAYGNYTYSYQWYLDGTVLSDTTPSILASIPGEYEVEIYIEELGCRGKMYQSITHQPSCSIDFQTACDAYANTIEVTFDYGFPPYTTQISGSAYNQEYIHQGNIIIADIPYGGYTVRTTDRYGEFCQSSFSFVDTFNEDILIEKIIESEVGMTFCTLNTPYNGYTRYLCSCCGNNPFKYTYDGGTYPANLVDASINLSRPQDFSFEWFKDGVSLGIYDAQVILAQWYNPVGGVEGEPGILHEYTVVATHTMGCSIESGFLAEEYIWVLPYIPANVSSSNTTYESRVYPNPNTSGATFYYYVETDGEETFEAEVELISMTGAVVARQKIRGNTSYTLPFQLITTGTYLIRTTTQDGEVLIDRIIVK